MLKDVEKLQQLRSESERFLVGMNQGQPNTDQVGSEYLEIEARMA
jgi:hypothetical protein